MDEIDEIVKDEISNLSYFVESGDGNKPLTIGFESGYGTGAAGRFDIEEALDMYLYAAVYDGNVCEINHVISRINLIAKAATKALSEASLVKSEIDH